MPPGIPPRLAAIVDALPVGPPDGAVVLRVMTADDVDDVVAAAVADARPGDVMGPDDDPDPTSWTSRRHAAFGAFLRSRLARLPDGRSESSFLVLRAGRVLGVARLVPSAEVSGEDEAGLWLARSHRGRGVGDQVLAQLVDRVRIGGGTALVADTTVDNVAALASLRRHGAELRPDPVDRTVRARIPVHGSRPTHP